MVQIRVFLLTMNGTWRAYHQVTLWKNMYSLHQNKMSLRDSKGKNSTLRAPQELTKHNKAMYNAKKKKWSEQGIGF